MFTVLVTNYNYAKYLPFALQTLFREIDLLPPSVGKRCSVCLVDDCSTDDSKTVISELREKYSKERDLRVAFLPKNVGLACSRNVAASMETHNPYMFFLDADDFMSDRGLFRLYEKIQGSGSLDIIRSPYNYFYEENQTFYIPRIPASNPFSIFISAKNEFFCYSRNLFEKVGGYDKSLRFWEDFDLLLRLMEVGKVEDHQNPVVCYRQKADRKDSLALVTDKDSRKALEVARKFFQRFPEWSSEGFNVRKDFLYYPEDFGGDYSVLPVIREKEISLEKRILSDGRVIRKRSRPYLNRFPRRNV